MRKAVWFTAALLLVALLALVLAGETQRQSATAGSGCSQTALCVVNTTADHTPDTCDPLSDDNDCTFREALGAADNADSIQFDIPGAGPHVIAINQGLGGLTVIPNGVSINGYTQPGASANSVANSSTQLKPGNADIQIVLDGSNLLSYGLWVKGNNVVIEGLSIVNFVNDGIFVSTFATSASIQGNYIGVLPDGNTPGPNGIGIHIRSSTGGNLVGGSQPAQRNVISGNTTAGVFVTGVVSNGNCQNPSPTPGPSPTPTTYSCPVSIAGNFIGTDSTGTTAVPNNVGISMAGGPFSTIGGNSTATANLVSGNAGDAIVLSTPDGSHMNIKGNRIGVKGDGTSPLPNGGAAVLLDQGASDNTIGGEFNAGEHNIIAYNGGAGVALTASAGVDNYIDPNDMYSNAGLGADLLDDGLPLPNDPGDLDGGNNGGSEYANRLMNYPVIDSATYDVSMSKLTVNATLDTVPGHYYNMFFFWNEHCDPSGYGEGQHFLGSLGVSSNASMPYQFSQQITKSLAGTLYLVMSASDPESSSEFGPCYELDTGVEVTASPTPSPTPTISPTPSPTATPSPTPTASPTPTPTPGPKQGDMNCDDEITLGDFSQFMRYLTTGERGPAPDNCPSPGSIVQFPYEFMDLDCSFTPTPAPGVTPVTEITTRDALILLGVLAGLPQNPSNCPHVGQRLS